MESKIITKIILFILSITNAQCQQVTLYTDIDKKGTSITRNLTGRTCIPYLGAQMDNAASTVDTHGSCIKFYMDQNCCGESIEVQSSAGKSFENLHYWHYNDVVSSVGPCDDPCSFWRDPGKSINVSLHANKNFWGTTVMVDLKAGCVNIPALLKNQVSSVGNHDLCVNLYKNINCAGESFSIRPPSQIQFNLANLDGFNDKVESISLCDYKCKSNQNVPSLNRDIKTMTMFRQPCFHGSHEHFHVHIERCYDFNEPRLIKSVRTYENCFIVYASLGCVGRNTTLSVLTSKGALRNISLDWILSIEVCPETVQKSKSTKADANETEEPSGSTGNTTILVIIIVFVIVLIAAIIIFCFILNKQKRVIQGLTDKEINEFKAGCGVPIDETSEYLQELVYNDAYNATYEMSKNYVNIDLKCRLGSGEQGEVYKGSLGYNSNVPIAIKRLKPNADVQYLKALLREVKVMIYVGKHAHIVEFLGCCTENLHKGEIYIILELCHNGALDKYLQKHEPAFQDLLQGSSNNISADSYLRFLDGGADYFQFNTLQLMQWILQIAEGMNYLAHKKIIHSDLATRNILLDSKFNAKVSDFGLSKQLYHYTQYVKKQQVPLPWRWLAIESLKSLQFSLESDVWSFGITMWEIFSLGVIPYPGVVWNEDFIKQLKNGLRPSKPEYSTMNHYKIMIDCWKEMPSERPTFPVLRTRLQKVYAECIKNESANTKHLHTSIYCAPHLPCISENE